MCVCVIHNSRKRSSGVLMDFVFANFRGRDENNMFGREGDGAVAGKIKAINKNVTWP